MASGAAPSTTRRKGGARAPSAGFPDPHHDHHRCASEALDRAAALCAARRERLTTSRRHVLEIVWRGHHPIGAYAILEILQRELRKKIAPPTVYRALDFLQAQGLVHRVESLNAYVGCHDPETPHSVQFMICRSCKTAVELHDDRIAEAISSAASASGFTPAQSVVELSGLCGRCARSHGGSPAPG